MALVAIQTIVKRWNFVSWPKRWKVEPAIYLQIWVGTVKYIPFPLEVWMMWSKKCILQTQTADKKPDNKKGALPRQLHPIYPIPLDVFLCVPLISVDANSIQFIYGSRCIKMPRISPVFATEWVRHPPRCTWLTMAHGVMFKRRWSAPSFATMEATWHRGMIRNTWHRGIYEAIWG